MDAFKQRRVLTLPELSALLHCSAATVHRRLKEWGTLTSYNDNGRCYTLPSIPQFDKKGLWRHEGVFFSKHGTLKDTVIHLVRISRQGLSNQELEGIVGTDPTSYLAQRKQLKGLKAEKHKGRVVYFTEDEEVHQRQRRNRFPPQLTVRKLPPDALGIIILVEVVRNPRSTTQQLSAMLRSQGYRIDDALIENLLEHHGLSKKKLNTRSSKH